MSGPYYKNMNFPSLHMTSNAPYMPYNMNSRVPGAHPPGRGVYHPTAPIASPLNAGAPPLNVGAAPFNPGTPPLNAGAPPLNVGAAPFNPGTPPLNAGAPPLNVGAAPFNPGTPPLNAGAKLPLNAASVPVLSGFSRGPASVAASQKQAAMRKESQYFAGRVPWGRGQSYFPSWGDPTLPPPPMMSNTPAPDEGGPYAPSPPTAPFHNPHQTTAAADGGPPLPGAANNPYTSPHNNSGATVRPPQSSHYPSHGKPTAPQRPTPSSADGSAPKPSHGNVQAEEPQQRGPSPTVTSPASSVANAAKPSEDQLVQRNEPQTAAPQLPRNYVLYFTRSHQPPQSHHADPSGLENKSVDHVPQDKAAPRQCNPPARQPAPAAAPANDARGDGYGTVSPANVNAQQPTTSSQNPLVVLLLGCRGSGKSSQATALASSYNLLPISSGDLFLKGENPFIKLQEILTQNFHGGAKQAYSGVVLDRFISSGDEDAYYLDEILRACKLPMPMVFWLQVDPQVATQRAEVRGDKRNSAYYWRFVERHTQALVAKNVYEPIGCLTVIDTEVHDVQETTAMIKKTIDAQLPTWPRRKPLPDKFPLESAKKLPLIANYKCFHDVMDCIQESVGLKGTPFDRVPLSVISGYVDRTCFTDPASETAALLPFMHVTLKVDGQRFLVAKHKTLGFFGFPYAYKSCYDFNQLFAAYASKPLYDYHPRSYKPRKPTDEGPIELLLDTELAEVNGKVVLFVIDLISFYGASGRGLAFKKRYATLQKWFEKAFKLKSPDAPEAYAVELKEYRPINELREMLPSLQKAPYEIDGVVFQTKGSYRYGADHQLLKWKPQELCTADFRVMNGEQLSDGGWAFDLYVTVFETGKGVNEAPFEGAKGVFSGDEVSQWGLLDSPVVEMTLSSNNRETGETRWKFFRERSDKPLPNKLSIVQRIVEMLHLSYDELADYCSKIEFNLSW